MSLSKSFKLRCDVSELLMDRVMQVAGPGTDFADRLKETREDRRAQEIYCHSFSVAEDSAQQARRSAKSQGWIRHKEGRPIYPGSDTMTTVAYDLCQGCKPIAAQR